MKTHYVSSDKTVRKRVVKHGKIINKPTEGSICHLNIENIDITPSNYKLDFLTSSNSEILNGNSNIVVTIDETNCEIDRQIERAIKWMGENEIAIITINLPSSHADNNKDEIKITFKATLTKHERIKYIWEWTPEEKYSTSLRYKQMAVKLINDNRIKDAFYRFSKAVKLLITLEPIDDLELDETLFNNINKLRTNLYNNMAMCQLKYNNYDYAIDLCTKVLLRDGNNVKAMYRRGCAYGNLKNIERALNDFQKAVHVEPTNMAAWEKMKIYSELWQLANKRSDDMLKKMFCL
ncbi:hypothetical protein PV326_006162 [Microctonus aethiopoides]|uniref:BDBT FKBP like N-terminal domain-containing protein n=1 Tax=Microctonus aethiopoides TaxID=144406 RepID=A0AA39C4E2_9HYME|nr:hypothetical protein PV326_006162 [Microctonus aethiopoides]KAK0157617.1 hypothetical protein PV328_011332 [Microctonus aethiopoides]